MADVEALIQNLKTGDDYSRGTAARALGELGGEKATAALIEALGDEDVWVQEYAAEALGKLASKEATGPLGELLKSDNYMVRISAATALGRIGGDEARGLLEPLKDDPDSWVRDAVIVALQSFGAGAAPVEATEEVRVPKPSRPEIEAEPELVLDETSAGPEDQADASIHSLADRIPRTPEAIVREIAADTSIKYKVTRSGFLLRVSVGGGRHQKVRLKFNSVDEDGSPIIQVFTVVGPAQPKHYQWALKLNPAFSYGAIGIVKIDGKEVLAIIDTLLEENVDVRALEKSVRTVARKGDALEKKLIHQDLW